MLALKNIRINPELYKKNESDRFCDPKVVDELLEIDKQCSRCEFVNSKNSQLKKMISTLARKDKKTSNVNVFDVVEVNTLNADSINFDEIYKLIFGYLDKKDSKKAKEILDKFVLDQGEEALVRLSKYIDGVIINHEKLFIEMNYKKERKLNSLSNILHETVPIDNNEDNNVIIFKNEIIAPTVSGKVLGHLELSRKYNLVDTKRGINVAGNRGYFLTGMGVRLNMALMMYAMDFLTERGFTPMAVPHFMNGDIAEKLCQLQEYDETLYKIQTSESDPKYLIATSEQPLTGYFMDYKFLDGELPVKFCGTSTCYRKETGRSGVDTLGIFRVHQFEKIEQLCITDAKSSWEMMEQMLSNSKEFYDTLGIKYRVINIVSGALNNAAAKKYDLEGYFNSTGTYRELVSCSNCTDYFSKKLNIKDKYGNYVHMLNATLCANTRTICCLLEQNQTDNGILIPEVLRKYFHNYSDIYIK